MESSFFALGLFSMASNTWASKQQLTIENCHIDGIKEQVQCGKLLVPENYQQPTGEQISINFSILPTIDNGKNKELRMER